MITFRPAKPSDALIIASFQVEMARETESIELNAETCRKGVLSVFESDNRYARYFVAENDNTIIGSLMVTYEWSDWRNGVIWWIQSLFILPAYRGRGIYSSMYQYLKEITQSDENIKGIRLYVDTRNKPARAIYERLGMIGDHYRVYEWMK